MLNYSPINLPSGCKTYSGVDKSSIRIRPFTGGDEKLLAGANANNFDKNFLIILERVLTGIDPKKLTIGDKLYVTIWEAVNSYSNVVDLDLVCEDCLQKISIQVDLGKLEKIELPEDYKEPYPITLSDGKTVQLRLLTVEDEIKIAEFEKKDPENSYLYGYSLSIVDDFPDKMAFLESISSQDLAKIRVFHEKFYHGPNMETFYVCTKCGGGGKVRVPFRLDFILPYGNSLRKLFGSTI